MNNKNNLPYDKQSIKLHSTSFLDYISVPVILLEKDNVLFMNKPAYALLEIGNQEISNIRDILVLNDDVNTESLKILQGLKENLDSIDKDKAELRIKSKIGKEILCKFCPVQLNSNNYILLELAEESVTDNTGEKSSASISSLGYSNLVPACTIDSNLDIIKCNTAFKELLLGKNFGKIDSALLKRIIPNDRIELINSSLEDLKTNPGKYSFETNCELDLSEGVQFHSKIEIIKENGSSTWLAVIKDLTKEVELLKDLEKAKRQASNLKSIFVAQISHEIRTPINAILSFANLIKEELKDKISPDIRSGFEVINRGGERIIRTINLILDTSEVMTDSYEYIPKEINVFTEIFNEVFMRYRKIAQSKSIQCSYTRDTDNLLVMGDEYMIKQIIGNIMDNAVKFTSEGQIEATVSKNNEDKLVIEIADTGIGISQEYIDKVYEPFTQEDEGFKRRYEGNGLGLTLTKSYCNINNIDISISSNKSKGTKVALVFNNSVSYLQRQGNNAGVKKKAANN